MASGSILGTVRNLALAFAAAVLGCAIAALVLVGGLDASSFMPVPVFWAGTLALVAPTDAALRRRGLAMPLRAVPVVIVGALVFALTGWLLSGGMTGTAVMGLVYGMLTAACWAALSVAVPARG